MYRYLILVLLGACAGKGEVGGSGDGALSEGDTDTDSDTDTEPTTPTDITPTPIDTGTVAPPDELVVSAERVGLTIEVTLQTDGVAGPWTITVGGTDTLVTVTDLSSWDLAESEGVWVTGFDPCVDLGTIVTVAATDGTLLGSYDLDLAGSIVAVGDTGNSSDMLDLTGLPTPIAMCGGATADQFDIDAWILAGLPVADWRVDVIAPQGNLDIEPIDPNSVEPACYATFAATASLSFSVAADPAQGFGPPIGFTTFVDAL